MIKYLIGSVSIINANILLVLLLSLVSIYISPEELFLLALINLIVQIFLYPILYGRLIDTLNKKPKMALFPLFKTHAWNYYAVVLIFYVPAHIIINVLGLTAVEHQEMQGIVAATHIGLLTLLAILFIYILPLIFLMRKNISTIPMGLTLLLMNVKKSLPLILLALLHPVIKWGLPSLLNMEAQENVLIILTYGFFLNFILFYINFMIFTAAASFLMKESHLKDQFNY